MILINYLTRIQFGQGAIRTLCDELKLLGVSRPLVVTDKGIARAGIIEKVCVEGGLHSRVQIYDGTPENPDEFSVLEACSVYQDAGCDSIVAVGGGSPLDLGKVVSLLTTHVEPLERYAFIYGGLDRITANKPPVVAIPTTSGTGSEVGRAALITLNDGRKLGILSPHMVPNVAICDPDLTLGLPPHLTAATGMDAITHCIETYLSPRYNPPAEAIAIDGLRRAMQYLRRAVRDGQDREARKQMMMAALEGGLTFQKGLGAVHGMSHALGGLKSPRLHHGTLNAVILPTVLAFNGSHARDKYVVLRSAMGLAEGADIAQAIVELNSDLGLPPSLGAMGIQSDCIPTMIERALADHSTATNVRPLSAADYKKLFESAMEGA